MDETTQKQNEIMNSMLMFAASFAVTLQENYFDHISFGAIYKQTKKMRSIIINSYWIAVHTIHCLFHTSTHSASTIDAAHSKGYWQCKVEFEQKKSERYAKWYEYKSDLAGRTRDSDRDGRWCESGR